MVLFDTGSSDSINVWAATEHGGAYYPIRGFTEYDDVPCNAHIGSGDYLLSVEEILLKLLAYATHLEEVRGSQIGNGPCKNECEILKSVRALLNACTGHDSLQANKKMVLRNAVRRLQVNHLRPPND